VKITCASDITFAPAEIEASDLYQHWLEQIDPSLTVEAVHVYAALRWNGAIRMAFVGITGIGPDGNRKTEAALLRGATVDILAVVVAPDGTEYGVLVEQGRFPVGQVCTTNPSGMVDGDTAKAAALRELDEEVGGGIVWSDPLWLNHFATGSDAPMLVTEGGSDEEVQFCAVFAHLTAEQMRALDGSIAGVEKENEQTKVHVVLLSQVLAYLARDGRRPPMKPVLSHLLFERMKTRGADRLTRLG